MSPLAKYVLRSFRMRPAPSALLIGTMVLVGFVIAAMGAIGINLRQVFQRAGSPNRVLVLAKGAVSEFDSNLPVDAQREIAATQGVTRASAELLYRTDTWLPDKTLELAMVRGLDEVGFDMHAAKVVTGRRPNAGEREIMVGATLLERHPELAVGQNLKIGTHPFTCVGVFSTGDAHEGEAWTTRTALDQELRSNSIVTEMLLEADSPASAAALIAPITANQRFQLRAEPESRYYQAVADTFRPVYIGLLVLLFLVGGGAALAATSALAVVFAQRLGDLAVLQTLGFPRGRLARLVLVEVELLALCGGALGAGVAAAALRGYVAFVAAPGAGAIVNFHADVSPTVLGVALGVMAAIGLVAAAVPLVRLRRLDLQESLRAGAG